MNSERRVAHLWKFAVSMDADSHVKKLLKSNFSNICRKLAGTTNPIFSKSQMCPQCGIHWEDNLFQIKVRPQGLQITTNKARKLIDKFKQQESCPEERTLTKKQKQRAKWLMKRAASKLEISCNFCKHKTLMTLDKTKKEKILQKTKQLQHETEVSQIITNPASKTKKKKKNNNKDKTAGIKIQNKQNLTPQIQPKRTPVVANLESKKTKPKTLKQKAPPPKIQTKTQKQNSLLQLAALLKSKDNSNKNTKNHLQSFLE